MSLFHYKAIDKEGATVEGDIEAENRIELAHKLKADGVSVIAVSEKGLSKFNIKINIPFLGGVKAHDKIIFARNLGSMIEAGLPMTRALSIMERQSKGELRDILVKIQQDVSTGQTLSQSMAKYPKIFSQLFISMVKAGEESGNLTMALKNVALQMEKSYQLTKKVRGAMMYPAVIFSLMIVIGVLMMVYMVPTLSSTFAGLGIKLPLSTRIIIATSNILKEYFILIIIGVIVSVIGTIYFLRTKIGSRMSDYLSLHTPIIGDIVKEVNAARTARTLSSLLSSGVDIVVALSVTEEVLQNSYYKAVLKSTQATIQKGDLISKIFAENEKLYPLFVGEMMSVGEETGKIGEMLLGVAEFYEEDVDQRTKDMSSVIEPFIMIVIGVAVGAFAISMLAPTYSLVDAI